jgi:hypothetical protein
MNSENKYYIKENLIKKEEAQVTTEKLRSTTKNLDLINCVTEEGNTSTD